MQIVQMSGTIILKVLGQDLYKQVSLQGVYKLSNRWVIVRQAEQTNSTMSVVKCILI